MKVVHVRREAAAVNELVEHSIDGRSQLFGRAQALVLAAVAVDVAAVRYLLLALGIGTLASCGITSI